MTYSTTEMEKIFEDLHAPLRRRELAIINGSRAQEDLDAMDAALQSIAEQAAIFAGLAVAATPAPYLTNLQRRTSITKALRIIGRAEAGGVVLTADAFLDRLVAAVEGEEAEFWSSQPAGLIGSLLSAEPEIVEVLEKDGILAWCGNDGAIRIVNARFVEDEKSIAEFVTGPAPSGRVCRFCSAVEPHDSQELQPIESDRRGQYDALESALEGKRQVAFDPGRVFTHQRCADYWLRWVEIARRLHAEAAA